MTSCIYFGDTFPMKVYDRRCLHILWDNIGLFVPQETISFSCIVLKKDFMIHEKYQVYSAGDRNLLLEEQLKNNLITNAA